MKGVKIALVSFLCVIILGLCVLLGYGISGQPGGRGVLLQDYRMVQEKEFSPEEIGEICIDYDRSGNDVFVYEGEGDAVIVREYANYEADGSELAEMAVKGGRLTVKGPRRSGGFAGIHLFGIHSKDIYTEVWLPGNYTGGLDIGTTSGDILIKMDLSLENALNLQSTSGDIAAGTYNFRAKKIYAESTSGDIMLSDLEAEEIRVCATSGDIWIERAEGGLSCSSTSGEITVRGGAGNRTVSSNSGDIWVESLSGQISAGATSGEITISGSRGYGDVSTTSGDVEFSLEELSGDVTVGTTSGEVRLVLPRDVSLEFEADTNSGEIDTCFDDDLRFSKRGDHAEGTVGSGEKRKLKINTTSGDIQVDGL